MTGYVESASAASINVSPFCEAASVRTKYLLAVLKFRHHQSLRAFVAGGISAADLYSLPSLPCQTVFSMAWIQGINKVLLLSMYL